MVRKRYPTGVRPLLTEAAARRKRAERRFVQRLEAGGYEEIILPILDFVDVYAPVTAPDAARRTYRFTDREGELVALRSDFTPMVARALAPSLSTHRLLRVFYRGDVIRCDPVTLGTSREIFQIGAELVGDASADADLEILTLAAELAAGALVVYRDPDRRLDGRLDARFVRDETADDDITSYYTGLRFSVYVAGTRRKIAQGGRYDSLYERFGAAAPAVGFTYTIDDLD